MIFQYRKSRCKHDVDIQGKSPSERAGGLFCDRRRAVGKTGASRCFFGIEDGGAGNLSSRVRLPRLSPEDVSAGSAYLSQKLFPTPTYDSLLPPDPARVTRSTIRTFLDLPNRRPTEIRRI